MNNHDAADATLLRRFLARSGKHDPASTEDVRHGIIDFIDTYLRGPCTG